jgi:hypothetical protein
MVKPCRRGPARFHHGNAAAQCGKAGAFALQGCVEGAHLRHIESPAPSLLWLMVNDALRRRVVANFLLFWVDPAICR